MLACEQVLKQLREQGWASLPLDDAQTHAYERLGAQARWFFDQPDDEKRSLDIRESVGHRGWVSRDEAGDYPDEGARRYEAFDIGRTPTADDRIEHPLRGLNRWPSNSAGQALRRDAEKMFADLSAFCTLIGDAICADLGVDPQALRRLRTEPVSQLRLIRYFEADPEDVQSDDRAAMGAHTDYEFFTLLYQDRPGTQVLDADGQWIDVPHERCVTLLVGDMLSVFSNGRYQSVLHRAAPKVPVGRISIPFFAGADYSAIVRGAVDDPGEAVCFGTHLLTQLQRDFPYLRDADDNYVIDLTGRGRRSAFEDRAWQRRSAMAGAATAADRFEGPELQPAE